MHINSMHLLVGPNMEIVETGDLFWFERLSVGSSMYVGRDTLELETILHAWFRKVSEATFKIHT